MSCRLESTFHRLYKTGPSKPQKTSPGKTAFTVDEENKLVSLLSSYAGRAYPLSENDLLDPAEVLISSSMTEDGCLSILSLVAQGRSLHVIFVVDMLKNYASEIN